MVGFTDRNVIQNSQLMKRLQSIVDIGQVPELHITGHSRGSATSIKILEQVIHKYPQTKIDGIMFAPPSIFHTIEEAQRFQELARNYNIALINIEGDVIGTEGLNHHIEELTGHIGIENGKYVLKYGSGNDKNTNNNPVEYVSNQLKDVLKTVSETLLVPETHSMIGMRDKLHMAYNNTPIDMSFAQEFARLAPESITNAMLIAGFRQYPKTALAVNVAKEIATSTDKDTFAVSMMLMLLNIGIQRKMMGEGIGLNFAQTTFLSMLSSILPSNIMSSSENRYPNTAISPDGYNAKLHTPSKQVINNLRTPQKTPQQQMVIDITSPLGNGGGTPTRTIPVLDLAQTQHQWTIWSAFKNILAGGQSRVNQEL